jgi:hypothetical protein
MTESDLKKIEAELKLELPEFYRATMLDYPFAQESIAAEFMLLNDPYPILDYNCEFVECAEIAKPFVVGGDGGEETYLIDLESDGSAVFGFDVETGRVSTKATDWQAYLACVRDEIAEVEADEQLEQARRAGKKWWQFWK